MHYLPNLYIDRLEQSITIDDALCKGKTKSKEISRCVMEETY